MAVNSEDVLSVVKSRLGLTDAANDGLILSYIEELGQKILHHCNITEVPDGLKFVWASMTIDLLKVKNPTIPAIVALLGTTIEMKVGDTTTKTTVNKGAAVAIVSSYAVELNHYRRMRW